MHEGLHLQTDAFIGQTGLFEWANRVFRLEVLKKQNYFPMPFQHDYDEQASFRSTENNIITLTKSEAVTIFGRSDPQLV